MIKVHHFTFNPFAENTYLVHDSSGSCIVVDPGCHTMEEQKTLEDYIALNKLTLLKLINTHCHIDHVLGNAFIFDKYGLKPEIHRNELELLRYASVIGQAYGIPVEQGPEPEKFLNPEELIEVGTMQFEVLFTPGHSPASICLYDRENKFVIAGDVLFSGSIGRTDLPGGNYETLMNSIYTELMTLEDEVIVYSGHGPSTSIGIERKHNPFLSP